MESSNGAVAGRTVNARLERNKLASRDTGWNLNGSSTSVARSQTRGNGMVRPILIKAWFGESRSESEKEVECINLDNVEEKEELVEEIPQQQPVETEEEPEQAAHISKKKVKPSASRAILEVEALAKAFAATKGCPDCGSVINLEVKTVCLASSVILTCKDLLCSFVYHGDAASATILHVKDNNNFDRMMDYDVNVLYVVGFLSCGDGCTEAARLLGFMGLPNDTTMETRSFSIIKNQIAPTIFQLLEQILLENFVEEVKATATAANNMYNEEEFLLWQQSIEGNTFELDKNKYPVICGSFDMAWLQRSSGQRYNSLSGHGLMMGMISRKPLSLVVKSKICNVSCKAFAKKASNVGKIIQAHICCKNHEGSPGAMEASACLEIVCDLYRKRHVAIDKICCDEDSSIRADCKWSNADYMANNNTNEVPKVPITKGINKGRLQERKDKGKLPGDIVKPSFVADPNHCCKQLTGELIALDVTKVAVKFTMTRMDTTRIGKNFGYMARTLNRLDEDLYCLMVKAVLEHHFYEHKYCRPWCCRKDETLQQRQMSGKYY
jgi:hypothetical protein